MEQAKLDEMIWQMVAAIPSGHVASYGQIARLCGYPRHARYVGRVLKQLPPDSSLLWFRVVTASGRLAFAEGSEAFRRQREKLLDDGVAVIAGKVNMRQYGWNSE